MDSLPWKTGRIRKLVEAGSGRIGENVRVTLTRQNFPLTLRLPGKESQVLSSKVFFFFFPPISRQLTAYFCVRGPLSFTIVQNVSQNAHQKETPIEIVLQVGEEEG